MPEVLTVFSRGNAIGRVDRTLIQPAKQRLAVTDKPVVFIAQAGETLSSGDALEDDAQYLSPVTVNGSEMVLAGTYDPDTPTSIVWSIQGAQGLQNLFATSYLFTNHLDEDLPASAFRYATPMAAGTCLLYTSDRCRRRG